MKTVLKFLVTGTGLLLILMAIALILFSAQASSIADFGIERSLSFVYQADVSIDRVVFLPRESSMVLYGLKVQNPKSFKEGIAMSFDEVSVRVDPATLFSRKPVVEDIVLRGATYNVRYEAGHGTNLAKLDENAQRLEASASNVGLAPEYTVLSCRSEESKLSLEANFVPGAGLNLTLAPFDVQEVNGPAVSTGRICTLLIRNLFREAVTLRGLVQPAAERLKEEMSRMNAGDASN